MARISKEEEEQIIEVPKDPVFDPATAPQEEPMPVEAPPVETPEREKEEVPA